MSPTASTDPRRATRTPLDRRRILEAALRLIDEHGLAELSMRRLGAELDVQAMSLYRHVPNKQAVVEGVRQMIFDQLAGLQLVHPESDDWRDSVRAAALAFREVGQEHPHALPLFASDVDRAYAASAGFFEPVLDAMVRAGFPEDAAVDGLRTVVRYMLSSGLLDTTIITRDHPLTAEERARLDAERPLVGSLVRALHDRPPHTLVEPGLELLLAGLETQLDAMRAGGAGARETGGLPRPRLS